LEVPVEEEYEGVKEWQGEGDADIHSRGEIKLLIIKL
jgi:hypothetical protein